VERYRLGGGRPTPAIHERDSEGLSVGEPVRLGPEPCLEMSHFFLSLCISDPLVNNSTVGPSYLQNFKHYSEFYFILYRTTLVMFSACSILDFLYTHITSVE
jgi:hypothetical protein